MTEHDPLEAELFAFRPRELSADLRNRIADQLTPTSPVQSHRQSRSFWWTSALTGGMLTSLLAFVVWRGTNRRIESEVPAAPLQPLVDTAFDDSLPSVWAYRNAMTQSPEALDALLDEHAIQVPEPKPERARDYVSVRFASEFNALTGEL